MKVKTSELTGRALDWMTGVALGYEMSSYGIESLRARVPGLGVHAPWRPSYYWSQGGPIIEREGISWHCGNKTNWHAYGYGSVENFSGPTPLIAAMRCYVASRLGEEVDVPEELK